MNIFKLLPFLALVLLGFRADAQKSYVLKQDFPIGKNYDFTLISDQIINQQMAGKKLSLSQNIGTEYRFDIRNGEGSEKYIEVTYKRIFMKSKGMGNQMEMDSDDPDTTKENSFRGIKGATFNMVMLPDGAIKSLTGIEQMVTNMVSKMKADSTKAANIKASLSQQFNSEGMKHTLESSLKIYPDHPVKIGESWTVDTKMQLNMPVETITKYTLTAVRDDIAYLNINGSLLSKGSFQSMGNKIDTDLTGTNIGDAELDLKTGLILKSHLRIELSGKMQTGGEHIDFELQGINKIVGKETVASGLK
ncbi:hypothetical protein GJU39_15735 [Pedobacter petrophilus]|uniref:Uncharacterized protein n=1 Tax=Pedobacter petrophilus TaxID=1908241 RepID=A0A7K0G122_9SPHI|nr:DUF6263 family protein [Pedobacter petrophilus]MRX77538.1 hypothetical protein [Pedobacter petrophilus]